MVDATEQERRRIERDLHDGAGQQLVSLAMTLGMAKEKFATDPEAARALVDEGHQEAKQALATLRNIVRGSARRGMIKAPSTLSPTTNLAGARARAQVVLQAMVDAGAITAAEVKRAPGPGAQRARGSSGGIGFADQSRRRPRRRSMPRMARQFAEHAAGPADAGVGRGGRGGAAFVAVRAMASASGAGGDMPQREVLAMVGGGDYASSASQSRHAGATASPDRRSSCSSTRGVARWHDSRLVGRRLTHHDR